MKSVICQLPWKLRTTMCFYHSIFIFKIIPIFRIIFIFEIILVFKIMIVIRFQIWFLIKFELQKREWVWLRLYFLQAIWLLHYKYWSHSMWKRGDPKIIGGTKAENVGTPEAEKGTQKQSKDRKINPKKTEKKSRENRAKNPEQRNNTQREWEERNTAYIENCHRHSLHLCRHPCTKKTPKPVTESRHLHHHLRSSWKNKAYGHRSKKKQRERS